MGQRGFEDYIPACQRFSERKVSEAYGVLVKPAGIANRATFVIDGEGKIQHIEEGSAALNPDGAALACSRIKK